MKIINNERTIVKNDLTYQCEVCSKTYTWDRDAEECERKCKCQHETWVYTIREIAWDKPTGEFGIWKCCKNCKTEMGETKFYDIFNPEVIAQIFNLVTPSRVSSR